MIVATDALRPPQIRIGHIAGNITLPRTIPLRTLLIGGGGALLGLSIGFIIGGGNLSFTMYGTATGAALGAFLVSWSPLKGESLGKWLGLKVLNSRRKIKLKGESVQLAVGIAVLTEATIGKVHLFPGAVNVPPSQYDERGVRLRASQIFDHMLDASGLAELDWVGVHAGEGHSLEDHEELWEEYGSADAASAAMRRHRAHLAGDPFGTGIGGPTDRRPAAGSTVMPNAAVPAARPLGPTAASPSHPATRLTPVATAPIVAAPVPQPAGAPTAALGGSGAGPAVSVELGDLFDPPLVGPGASVPAQATAAPVGQDHPASPRPEPVAGPLDPPAGNGWTRPGQ
jgi:hypothetical protein